MALPRDQLSDPFQPAEYLEPDAFGRPVPWVDYEKHGAELNDPSQGWQVRNWRARVAVNDVMLSGFPYTTETVLLTIPGITELSLSFDQNVQPAIAYKTAAGAFLYWYDTTIPGYTTITLPAGITSMYLTMDDKRPIGQFYNDILLFYLRANALYYRQQRERFTVERLLKTYVEPVSYISACGMTKGLRMQLHIA